VKRFLVQWCVCRWLAICVIAGMLADAPVLWAAPADSEKMEALRRRVWGDDRFAAMQALRELAQMEGAQTSLLPEWVRGFMGNDAAVAGKWAGVIDGAKVKQFEAEVALVRGKARVNLEKLAKGDSITAAKQFQVKLKELLPRLNIAYGQRWQVIEAMRRRAECAAMLERLGKRRDEAGEAAIAAQASKALGLDLETALAIPELGDANEPRTDAPEYGLWFYRACRKIEDYNRSQGGVVLNKWEAMSVRLLNEYREGLGLFPLEIDPRLTEAARRHSKEMCDLKYFAHASPTAGRKMPIDRMRAAGYSAGWRENICANVGDSERAFTLWFNSPGHHLAMLAPEETAIGCGRWDNAWTHTFGHGLRLMLKDKAGHAKALKPLAGAALAPQPDNAKLPPLTVTRVETDITIIDPRTGQKVMMPGGK